MWEHDSIEFFFTLKKNSLPFQRLAKQELKIKVAENFFEGTLYLSASHHKFFFLGSTPLWAYNDLKLFTEPILRLIPADVLPNVAENVSVEFYRL